MWAWLNRVFRRKPVITSRFQPRRYRYSAQSGTYCRVLESLDARGPAAPVTAKELRDLLKTTTVPAILGQMKRDGLVSAERTTPGRRIFSYRLTEAGEEAAVRLTEAERA